MSLKGTLCPSYNLPGLPSRFITLYQSRNTGYTGLERQMRAFSRYTLSVEALSADDALAVQ